MKVKIIMNLLLAVLILSVFSCESKINNDKPTDPTDTTNIDPPNTDKVVIRDTVYISNNMINRIVEGQSYSNTSTGSWGGVDIEHSEPILLTFRNNFISSKNLEGYMLNVGDEDIGSGNNNLDDGIVTGNMITWKGDVHDTETITHGLFNGYQKNTIIKYNYLEDVPMGIIRKSGNNMTNESGGVAYNIVKGGKVAVNIKGMSNINVYNNTFYADLSPSENWRGIVYIYTNTDGSYNSVAHDTKIYNNIFYTVYDCPVILVESDGLNGFESDYNIFWCENGEPSFRIDGNTYSFSEWNLMGYDLHSKVMNPNFKDFISFVPTTKLSYGINIGEEWKKGLSTDSKWVKGLQPKTTNQGSTWQVGAVLY